MKDCVLYVHGKGGSAAESGHYKKLFPEQDVIGLDYRTFTPWETGKEIREAVERFRPAYENITLIANSIGAYFCMQSGIGLMIGKAYFISPVVDMERLIRDMMAWAGVTEDELRARGRIRTEFGEDLSWDYLEWVRSHPVHWEAPTRVLYGSKDALVAYETVRAFTEGDDRELTVMENGEHWFHTEEQMRFVDEWIRRDLAKEKTWEKRL